MEKIVIIVSHDDEVLKYGDVHIRFLDQRIEQGRKSPIKKKRGSQRYLQSFLIKQN